jgi:hypothetical protein
MVVVLLARIRHTATAATTISTAASAIQRRNRFGERALDFSRVCGNEAEIRIDTSIVVRGTKLLVLYPMLIA